MYTRHHFLQLNGSDDEKTENWIVKIPPNDTSDRRVAQTAQVDKREIHFYTEALPEIEVINKIPIIQFTIYTYVFYY